jgi:uncharacterized protein (UPF0305 family)
MGLSSSKTKESVDPIEMEVVLDKGVKEQITKLGDYVSLFNSNDVTPLLQIVKDYKIDLKNASGNTYDLKNIENIVSKFHGNLLEQISKEFPTLSKEEQDKKLSNVLKNKGLSKYLTTNQDNEIVSWKDKILQNSLVKKDTEMSNSVNSIFDGLTGLKSKYKYFEYRYIQLNLFLIIFIQHTYTIMDNFINTVLAYTITRDRAREESVKELIDLLLKIMKSAELNINQKDFEAIDQLMSVIQNQIKDKEVKLDKAINEARTGALDEMLKVIVNNSEMFKTETFDNISASSSTSTSSRATSISGGFVRGSSIFPEVNTSSSIPTTIKGGFVRGSSVFPQAFYDLKAE